MRLYLKWIFVSLYLMGMVRPILPFIEYELNKEYISEFLCINRDKPKLQCDGKCHLAQELREATGDNTSEENSRIPSYDSREYPVSPLTTDELDIHNLDLISEIKYHEISVIKTSDYHALLLRPPKIVLS